MPPIPLTGMAPRFPFSNQMAIAPNSRPLDLTRSVAAGGSVLAAGKYITGWWLNPIHPR